MSDNVFPIRGNGYRPSLSAATDHLGAGLKSGDGGGTSDGMEARVAKLEVSVSHIERDIGALRADVKSINETLVNLRVASGVMDERVKHLPTKTWAISTALLTIAVLTAVMTLAPKLQAWLGISH